MVSNGSVVKLQYRQKSDNVVYFFYWDRSSLVLVLEMKILCVLRTGMQHQILH